MIASRPRPRRFSTLFFLGVVFALLAMAHKCQGAAVDGEQEVARWEVAYGMEPGVYDQVVDAGAERSYDFTGLEPGRTYYFVVTAIRADGARSQPSAAVSWQVPAATKPEEMPVKLHVYQVDLMGRRTLLATLYVARKEKDFFQFGIETE